MSMHALGVPRNPEPYIPMYASVGGIFTMLRVRGERSIPGTVNGPDEGPCPAIRAGYIGHTVGDTPN